MEHRPTFRLASQSRWLTRIARSALLLLTTLGTASAATVNLADQPIFAGTDVPGNLALALSVEFPTAISVANLKDYADATEYLGYFDPKKCYDYVFGSSVGSYFQPASFATGTYQHSCSGQWSGNFMNWATMQTIDPFRWALSGGYRNVDTNKFTILEKAWGSTQGSAANNFPPRHQPGSGSYLPTTLVSSVTPFTWSDFNFGIWGNGNTMVFAQGSGYNSSYTSSNVGDLTSVAAANTSNGSQGTYRVYVRVRVCDSTTAMGAAGVEGNCTKYGNNYKPEGLLQQYANKIRYSAFSYLNQNGYDRQGGVLREPMGFIGPTYPTPLSSTVTVNPTAEWSSATGIMNSNPDTTSAGNSNVTQSGVMNFLNKFGESAQNYMTYDDVSELYYAVVRYFENLGNVSEWSNSLTSSELDGFPAVTTWSDPIAYSCQKNFILGIGDDHTWYDYNVGGGTASGSRAKPAAVSADTLNMAASWTTALQNLEGIAPTPWWPFDSGATYYIAGLAFGVHVTDIRPDLTGTQSIATYWMDVMESQRAENLNPYYLAAKYGGFSVPSGYSISNPTAPTLSSYDTSNSTINMNGNIHNLPDNYFQAGNANQMVTSLKSAFTNIANAIKAYTTSFALSTSTVSSSGTTSFASQYDSNSWTSVISASTLSFSASGAPLTTPLWVSSTTLQAQLAGSGWQTARRVATWNGSSGVAFQAGNLTASQQTALTPSYSPSTSYTQFVNYLRGDQTNEVGSASAGGSKSLRTRSLLLGDIIDATLTAVAAPSQSFSASTNPGYAAFKTTWTTTNPRPTMVYAAANDGMLHAFVGSSGLEAFAYIPSAVIQGPNATPQVDGLVALGNPSFAHHYYVDATPLAFDVDFTRVGGNTAGSPSDWHTLLIGGLGKGGKSFYAIDVTDPASMNSESAVASKVQWEFTDTTMGYSFGAPIVAKTAKYGWVVILTSGYNNSDGFGYLYLVNPKTGALLQKIKTPSLSSGLTQASAFTHDYTDSTAESVYVGDLNGNLWRFDLTGTPASYPQPTLLAQLQDASGNAQPITTAPLIKIHPTTRKRYVLVGTGRLLATSDVTSSAGQTFYAILDGSAASFNAVGAPITRASMTPVTDITAGITLSATSKGWYFDLGSASGIAWRVIVNPTAYNGIVAFAALLTSTDACNPSGTSEVYEVNYGTATTVETTTTTTNGVTSTTLVANTVISGSLTNMQFVNVTDSSGNSTTELVAATSTVPIQKITANTSSTVSTRLLNWRDLPTAD